MIPLRIHNRKAISAVLTTIIILIASIVLGSGTVVFSTGLFQSGGQQQAIQVIGLKTWVNGTYVSGLGGPGGGIGWGAFAIKNTGDKILSVSSVTVRGSSVPYSSWYADTDPTRVGQNFQAQFNYTQNDVLGFIKGSVNSGAGVNPPPTGQAACPNSAPLTNPPTIIQIQETPLSSGNAPVCLGLQSGPIALNPGASAIIYYRMPVNILTSTDSGITSTTSILAGTATIAQTVRVANP